MKQFIAAGIMIATVINLYSCVNKTKDAKDKTISVKKEKAWVIESPLKKFILSYDSILKSNTNTLVFLKESFYDTCFLIQIKQQGSLVRGLCYILSPELHRGFEDYIDKKHELLFFEGFSFKLENVEWSNIERFTNEALQKMKDTVVDNSLCLHCSAYTLNLNGSQRSTGNSQLQDEFAKYEALIRSNVINSFLQLKKSKTPH